jgi:hypothetical protein
VFPVPCAALKGGVTCFLASPSQGEGSHGSCSVSFAAAFAAAHISCRAKAALFVSSFRLFYFSHFFTFQIQAASLCVGSISLSFSSTPVKARRTPLFVFEYAEP